MVKGSLWATDTACVPTGDFGSERERERELNGLKNQDQAQVVKEEAYFEADIKENCEFQCV